MGKKNNREILKRRLAHMEKQRMKRKGRRPSLYRIAFPTPAAASISGAYAIPAEHNEKSGFRWTDIPRRILGAFFGKRNRG